MDKDIIGNAIIPKTPPKTKRDWFGYLFTTALGLVVAVGFAWYQSYTSEKEVAAAEQERAKAVIQSAVAIVEEHALNGKRLENDRLVRLIDKRRRDERIGFPISVSDVVERAEFNIASSHHLSVDRKEDIKPVFDAFYDELRARAFRSFPASANNADVFNSIARSIQSGKPADALSGLSRLSEAHAKELADAKKASKLSVFDGINRIFSSPTKLALFAIGMLLYSLATYRFMRGGRYNRWRRGY